MSEFELGLNVGMELGWGVALLGYGAVFWTGESASGDETFVCSVCAGKLWSPGLNIRMRRDIRTI